MSRKESADLHMVLAGDLLGHLLLLVQNGFSMEIASACSVNAFLSDRLGLSPEYVEERIQTIFLDGKPVDDLDTAMVRDGSSLALSAAMPGLVGAAMRRGGYYGQLRSTITYQPGTADGFRGKGSVRVKVFNLLMHELGPDILGRGVSVPAPDLAAHLSRLPEEFWSGCSDITLDGEPSSRDTLLVEGGLSRYGMIRLKVTTGT